MADCYFDIDEYSFEQVDCSPSVEDDFIGIKLNAPERIALAEHDILPIYGTYVFDGSLQDKYPNVFAELLVTVVSLSNDVIKTTRLVGDWTPALSAALSVEQQSDIDKAFAEMGATPMPEQALLKHQGWFSANLCYFMESLRLEPGRYLIYASIGDVRSNEVLVEVVK